MPRFKGRIEVRLKRNQIDPEANTVATSLKDLNFPVEKVSVGKVYDVTVNAPSKTEAEKLVELMCSRLLANPVKDSFEWLVGEEQE